MHLSGFCSFFSKFRTFRERTRGRNTDFLSRKKCWMAGAGRKRGHFLSPSTLPIPSLSLPWLLPALFLSPSSLSLLLCPFSLSLFPFPHSLTKTKMLPEFKIPSGLGRSYSPLGVMESLGGERCRPQYGSSVRPGSRVGVPRGPNGHICV